MRFRILILLIPVLLAACSVEKKVKKAFLLGKYQNTIDLYKKQLAKNPNNAKANFFVAESYRLSNRPKEAEAYYAKAGGKGIDKDSVKFYYAQALKANGKYPEAKKNFRILSQVLKTPR